MLQLDRRRNPYPFTWEIPVGAALLTLLLLGLGVHAGRSLALWQAGAGWLWPTGRTLVTSLPAVLQGKPLAGLHDVPATPTTPALYGWILAVELVILACLALTTLWALKRWGPQRLRGMTTAAEAEATLGLRRLRKHRHIIRPDLYPSKNRKRQ